MKTKAPSGQRRGLCWWFKRKLNFKLKLKLKLKLRRQLGQLGLVSLAALIDVLGHDSDVAL